MNLTVTLSLWEVSILVGAGLTSGALNAAAGGGSLITFPALLGIGYPPVIANVTNNVAAFPGYVSGSWGYRHGLRGQRERIGPLVAVSAVGSLIGVGLILLSPPMVFDSVIPFLVLAACGLLLAQPHLERRLVQRETRARGRPGAGALIAQMTASVYGGYFSAALGVAVLALLGITIKESLQRLNALKALLQIVIGGVAALALAGLSPVAWTAVAIIAPASVVGGFVGAYVARQTSDRVLRAGIVFYGFGAAAWLFLRT